MRSFRAKPVGWRNESYRHYLASKGIPTRKNGRVTSIGQYRVVPVDERRLADYVGMNHYAARAMGFPGVERNTIVVNKNLTSREYNETAGHEYAEAELMRKGMGYFDAHRRALKKERSDGI